MPEVRSVQSDWERMDAAWDRMSADYGDRLKLSPGDIHYATLAEQFPVGGDAVDVLDLGAGLGFQLDAILARMPRARVTCVDVSARMLERLRERLGGHADRIRTRCESYVDADLGSGVFDYAISSLTVHHLPRSTKRDLFSRIRRSLRAGGKYLELDDMAPTAEMEAVGQRDYEAFIAGRPGGARGEWNHNMPFTIESERALLEEAGFSRVEVAWQHTYPNGHQRAIFACDR